MQVRLVVVATLLAMLPGAAMAGTAQDPEVVDDCGVGTVDDSTPITPWTDVCAAWLQSGNGVLTATIQLAEDVAERPNPSYYGLTWQTGDGCTHSVGLGDRQLSDHVPDPPNVHRGGGEGYRSFASRCADGGTETYGPLEVTDVVEDGATISFTLTLDGALAPVADQYQAGSILRGLTAATGVDCELCMIYSDETAPGRDHVVQES